MKGKLLTLGLAGLIALSAACSKVIETDKEELPSANEIEEKVNLALSKASGEDHILSLKEAGDFLESIGLPPHFHENDILTYTLSWSKYRNITFYAEREGASASKLGKVTYKEIDQYNQSHF